MTLTVTRRHLAKLGFASAALLALPPLMTPARAQSGTRNLAEMSLGDPDAPVTIVEYAMFTCPHCATFHEEVLPRLKSEFIDTGKVRFVYREVYFNRPSLWAAMVARCAPEDRYFGLVDLLFARQSEWTGATNPEPMMEALFAIGKQAGLTDADLEACMSDRDFAEALVAEFQKTAGEDGIESTPSFVINGEKVGNMSFEDFASRINAELG